MRSEDMVEVALLVAAAVLAGCGENPPKQELLGESLWQRTAADDDAEDARLATKGMMRNKPHEDMFPSLVQILAHPDHYHDRKVQVEGYLTVEQGGTALFLSESDGYYFITSNALLASFRNNTLGLTDRQIEEQFHGRYVLLEGTFDRTRHGNIYPGALVDITRLQVHEPHPRSRRRSPESPDAATSKDGIPEPAASGTRSSSVDGAHKPAGSHARPPEPSAYQGGKSEKPKPDQQDPFAY